MATVNFRPVSIRRPAVAGSFYPGNAAELNNMLDRYLADQSVDIEPPKAIIAPHAGYIYSGPIAASVYANIAKIKSQISTVVLLGPAHRVYVKGIAMVSNTHFATPLGNVSIDIKALDKIQEHPFVEVLDIAHQQEHSLEVHIPFLQKVLGDFSLVPLLVGDAEPEQVATILDELWGGDETLIVISSDLSHYLEYNAACKIDSDTTKLIENFEYKKIGPKRACGCMPMRGLLRLAQEKNMLIKTLDLRNSGDTAGSKDRVVGYGAYALFTKTNSILNDADKKLVFSIIHESIESGLKQGKKLKPNIKNYAKHLQKKLAVFITLKINGQLRGCIGTTEAQMSLIEAVAHYAHAAAFSDPRFKPLTEEEYNKLDISLSILTPASVINFSDEQDLIRQLRPELDGLIIAKGNAKATFLPSVWESIPSANRFVEELKRKAGIKNTDSPDKAWRYTAEYYQGS
ncbi:MAG: AmmeMemoRadiSam system protein B [Proteobacteria bacterium]|nr:AmmeMemoRadiSam system protein B [Pseudomonadota bacterium]